MKTNTPSHITILSTYLFSCGHCKTSGRNTQFLVWEYQRLTVNDWDVCLRLWEPSICLHPPSIPNEKKGFEDFFCPHIQVSYGQEFSSVYGRSIEIFRSIDRSLSPLRLLFTRVVLYSVEHGASWSQTRVKLHTLGKCLPITWYHNCGQSSTITVNPTVPCQCHGTISPSYRWRMVEHLGRNRKMCRG